MIFVPLFLYSIIEFIRGKRVQSLLVFFFFLTDGFQLVPTSLFDLGFGISKSIDFAIFYILALLLINILFSKKFFYFRKNKIEISLQVFLFYLAIIVAVNLYIFKVPLMDVLRVVRPFLLLFAFLVFRKLKKSEIVLLKRILFVITLFLYVIFILQILTGKPLLTGHVGSRMFFGNISFIRFYNQPIMNYYFLFYALFNNPFEGRKKILSQVIIVISFLLPMHRGFIASFLVLVFLGIYLAEKKKSKFIKTVFLVSLLLLPLSGLIIDRFSTSSASGVDEIIAMGIESYDKSEAETQTMYYRFAHTFERTLLVASDPLYSLFGIGFWTDDSEGAAQKFDFITGSIDKGNYDKLIVFFTNDIAWSVFFIRLGFLGTIIYLAFYFNLLKFFFVRREDSVSQVNLLYLLLFVMTSVTSVEIITIWGLMFPILDYQMICQEESDIALSKNINIEE